MNVWLTGLIAVSLPEMIAQVGPAPFAAAAVVLLVVVVFSIAALLRQRRRLQDESRSIVHALEELRSGRGRGHTEAVEGSTLGLVVDAVHRLGVELHTTWSAAETAAERWRAVTDAERDTAIVTTDTDGDIRSFSAGAAALTGWDEGEVLSRPAAVLFDENAYKDLLPKLTRRSLRAQGVTTRSTGVRRDGSTFQAEVSVRMLMGPASQPVGFMLLVRDITEQIRIENDLRDSERRYRGLVERLTDGVVIVKEGRIVYVNPVAELLCGRKGPELLGTPWRDRVATRDVLTVEQALDSLASGAETEAVRCTLLGADGLSGAEVRVSAARVEFAGGSAAMLLVRDETAERKIEEELRRNETRLDAVLEASANGVLVLSDDPARMVLMTNRALAEMFGLGVQDLLGASEDRLARLLHEAAPGAGAVVERILDRSASDEIAVVSIGGEVPRELEVRAARLTGRQGEGLGRVVACRDVTAQRRSERELQEMADKLQLSKIELEQSYGKLREVNDELESRTEKLDGMNRELRHLDTMKSDLIGNVSHELQTPLVSIRGYTEMILKERLGPISEEQRKGLSLSLKNIDRLIAMIDNLLAFSRTDPGLRDLQVSGFDLRPLVDESIALLAEKIEVKKLQVDVRIEGTGHAIRADRDKILQVFLNLLSNAVNFGRESGRITVAEGTAEGGHVTVSVEDDGVGIPEGALGRIFERHFQVRRGAGESATGSGIGLAIVRDILRLHGCTVDAESEEGRGTRFTFTLPLAPERAEASPSPALEIEESGPEPPETSPSDPTDESRPRLRIIRRYKP